MRALLVVLALVAASLAFVPHASASPCPKSPGSSCPPPCGPGLQPCTVPWPIDVVKDCLNGDPSCPLTFSVNGVCSRATDPECNGWLCVGSLETIGPFCLRDPCPGVVFCPMGARVDVPRVP